jgi:hypothetical protein
MAGDKSSSKCFNIMKYNAISLYSNDQYCSVQAGNVLADSQSTEVKLSAQFEYIDKLLTLVLYSDSDFL